MIKSRTIDLIYTNIAQHDAVAAIYDEIHVEIYNPTEQRRIRSALQKALSEIRTGLSSPRILDFGAGTGNLTRHLLDLNALVTAGDVSPGCLEKLKSNLGPSDRLQTFVLNGEDLCQFSDNAFDMVATYSVLHHIPDYLAAIDEIMRVVKPNGVIYIDHEVCPSYWGENTAYQCYLSELGCKFSSDHFRELGIVPPDVTMWDQLLTFLSSWKRRLMNKKILYSGDGDIHVYKNDHIEWDAVKNRLFHSCDMLFDLDYLLCREREDPPPVWNKWRGTLVDMHMVIARKKPL